MQNSNYQIQTNPKQMLFAAIAVIVVLLISFYAVYRYGVSSGDEQAAVRFDKREKEFQAKIKKLETDAANHNLQADVHLENERKSAGDNALQKQEIEIKADNQRRSDVQAKTENAAKIDKIQKDGKAKIEQIKADSELDSNVCAACEEYAAGGLILSEALCGKCRAPVN